MAGLKRYEEGLVDPEVQSRKSWSDDPLAESRVMSEPRGLFSGVAQGTYSSNLKVGGPAESW